MSKSEQMNNKKLDTTNTDTWVTRADKLGGNSYQDYLKSEHWKSVKQKAMSRPNYQKCEFCESQKVELHHISYKWLFTEFELRSIIALCRNHHEEVHKVSNSEKISVRKATNKLRKIYKEDFWKKNRI